VSGVRKDVHGRIFLRARERFGHARDLAGRDRFVVGSVEQEKLGFDVRHALREYGASETRRLRRDAAAVKRNRRGDFRAELGGGQEREPAAHAKPDDAVGIVTRRFVRVQIRERRSHVREKSGVSDRLDPPRDWFEVSVRKDVSAIEIRRERDVSEPGQPVALSAQIGVESERFHVHEDGRMGSAAVRDCEITARTRTEVDHGTVLHASSFARSRSRDRLSRFHGKR